MAKAKEARAQRDSTPGGRPAAEKPKEKGNTVSRVEGLIAPHVTAEGVRLWDLRFEKEGGNWFLRVFIDKEGGVSIDDCERVSRRIDPVLDGADPISQSYVLEVSSPGLGRKLTRPEHLTEFLGEKVLAVLIRPENGRREVEGALSAHDDTTVTLSPEGEAPVTLAKEKLAYIKRLDDQDLF